MSVIKRDDDEITTTTHVRRPEAGNSPAALPLSPTTTRFTIIREDDADQQDPRRDHQPGSSDVLEDDVDEGEDAHVSADDDNDDVGDDADAFVEISRRGRSDSSRRSRRDS